MGLFDFLRADPSQDWPEHQKEPLTLDLGKFAMNDVELGSDPEVLVRFGRPSNRRPFQSKRFVYEKSGMVIEVYDRVLGYFGFPIVAVESDEVGPGELTVICPDGFQLHLADGSEVNSLLDHLPKPSSIDRDETETVYSFRLAEYEFEIECSPDGAVRRVNLFRPE